MITELYVHFSVAILLASSVQTIRELTGTRKLGMSPILIGTATFLPIAGLSLGRWVYSFTGPISIPLTLILSWYALKPCVSSKPIDQRCLIAFWCMTVGIATIYFPMALGWTSFDPHGLGWNKQFIFVPMVAGIACLWMGQGGLTIAFLSSVIAWKAGLLESSNGWNYLVDPVAFFVCACSLASHLAKTILRRRKPVSLETATHESNGQLKNRTESIAA